MNMPLEKRSSSSDSIEEFIEGLFEEIKKRTLDHLRYMDFSFQETHCVVISNGVRNTTACKIDIILECKNKDSFVQELKSKNLSEHTNSLGGNIGGHVKLTVRKVL
ncbi:hypothetical protein HON22_03150 [Candidatus Peregrinibacteria bacterium]|jgi:hypothetical protein|nr:hypothetical protein [Candidatus Peregrinibacteria bacterium]